MNNTAVLVTTFLRDDHLFRCIKSIRKFYPDIAIYVSDNGEWSSEKTQFCLDHNCIYHKLSFDLGVSASRNEVLKLMPKKYKYIVICEDDIVFTKHTKLETWHTILETDPDIGIVGGMLKVNDTIEQHYEAEIWIKNSEYHIKQVTEQRKTESGDPYFKCDIVLNFFMMRKRVWNENPWDTQFKSAFEHSDFFLRLKYQTGWQVAYTPDVCACHNRGDVNSRYKKYRKRVTGWTLFADKWKVDTLISSYNQRGIPINIRDIEAKEKE